MISFLCLKMSAEDQCERSREVEKLYPKFPKFLGFALSGINMAFG